VGEDGEVGEEVEDGEMGEVGEVGEEEEKWEKMEKWEKIEKWGKRKKRGKRKRSGGRGRRGGRGREVGEVEEKWFPAYRFDVPVQEAHRVDGFDGLQDLLAEPQRGAHGEGASGLTPPQVGQVTALLPHGGDGC